MHFKLHIKLYKINFNVLKVSFYLTGLYGEIHMFKGNVELIPQGWLAANIY